MNINFYETMLINREVLLKGIHMNLDMPTPEVSGFVRTLNNMGYMTSALDPYSLAFTTFAPAAPGPALDIGAAYGIATLAALAGGARVIANDIDARHLDILSSRAPQEFRSRLVLAPPCQSAVGNLCACGFRRRC